MASPIERNWDQAAVSIESVTGSIGPGFLVTNKHVIHKDNSIRTAMARVRFHMNVERGLGRVVYDKFHVIQSMVEACDAVLKAESRADARNRNRLERTPGDVAQKPVELDREGSPEVGVDGRLEFSDGLSAAKTPLTSGSSPNFT
jgi:hypothetical protein